MVVHHIGEVTAIIQYHVRPPAVRANDGLFDAPLGFGFSLAFPGKHRDSGGRYGGGGMVLGREDIAG